MLCFFFGEEWAGEVGDSGVVVAAVGDFLFAVGHGFADGGEALGAAAAGLRPCAQGGFAVVGVDFCGAWCDAQEAAFVAADEEDVGGKGVEDAFDFFAVAQFAFGAVWLADAGGVEDGLGDAGEGGVLNEEVGCAGFAGADGAEAGLAFSGKGDEFGAVPWGEHFEASGGEAFAGFASPCFGGGEAAAGEEELGVLFGGGEENVLSVGGEEVQVVHGVPCLAGFIPNAVECAAGPAFEGVVVAFVDGGDCGFAGEGEFLEGEEVVLDVDGALGGEGGGEAQETIGLGLHAS